MRNILRVQSKRYNRSSCPDQVAEALKLEIRIPIFRTKLEILSLMTCTFQTLIENLQEIYA